MGVLSPDASSAGRRDCKGEALPRIAPSRLATLYIESSDGFVASAAVSIVTGSNNQFPGGVAPAEVQRLSRRTFSPTDQQHVDSCLAENPAKKCVQCVLCLKKTSVNGRKGNDSTRGELAELLRARTLAGPV